MPLVDSLIALANQATASDVALALGAVFALSASLNFVALLHALLAKSAPSPPPPSPTTIQYIIQPPARATYDAEYESDIAEEAAEEKTSRANARRRRSQTPPNLDPIIETITTEGALASAPQKPPLRSTGSIVEEALREQEQRNELVKKQTPVQILEELKVRGVDEAACARARAHVHAQSRRTRCAWRRIPPPPPPPPPRRGAPIFAFRPSPPPRGALASTLPPPHAGGQRAIRGRRAKLPDPIARRAARVLARAGSQGDGDRLRGLSRAH